ncbi:hypothetical protein [Streptomyces sp. 7-21]|jgi:hypothetical protein|nr:hypothetical protein [Streptomyces sp. 7-21]MBL1068741.1 hypothetical protein [Streptomyces sp. 7-21]
MRRDSAQTAAYSANCLALPAGEGFEDLPLAAGAQRFLPGERQIRLC